MYKTRGLFGENAMRTRKLTLLLLALALAMCLFGAAAGEMEEVLFKAANICMECIGLG
jgi:hypothetical protein